MVLVVTIFNIVILGVGFMLRKMAATATPTCEITQAGDEWNIKTMTTFKTTEIKFKVGELHFNACFTLKVNSPMRNQY